MLTEPHRKFQPSLLYDFSLKRVINRPKRGLGKISLAKIEKIAFENKFSLFEAICALDESDKELSKKIVSALDEFAANLKELKECGSAYELIDKLETKFGIQRTPAVGPGSAGYEKGKFCSSAGYSATFTS